MALTKITGQVINTATDVTVGVLTVTDTLAIGGTVSIGGTLTYEDVTNIDSIGIITARSTIDAQGDVSIADKIIHTGDTNTAIRFPAADTITAETGGSERFRIDSSGRFLIGTTTEGNESADELTINSSGNTGVTVRSGTSSNGSLYFSDATSGDAEYVGFVQYQHASNIMILGTSSEEKLRITSDGELLVGTTTVSPHVRLNQKLAVVNVGNYGGASLTNYGGTTAVNKAILDFNRSRGTSNASMTSVASGDGIAHIVFRGADGTNFIDSAGIRADVDGTPGTDDMPGRLTFETTADGSNSLSPRLTIDSSGRVLINTTNNTNGHISSSNLAVQGADLTIFKDSGGDNAAVSGHKLKFVTQSGSLGEIDVLSEGGGGPSGRGGVMRFYTKTNNTSSATERLRIDSNGHVLPGADDTYDLGSSSKRWRDIYTGDLNLSNKGKSNDVDGSWGDYTIQEGESDLFLINNRSGKKFKFNLTEVL